MTTTPYFPTSLFLVPTPSSFGTLSHPPTRRTLGLGRLYLFVLRTSLTFSDITNGKADTLGVGTWGRHQTRSPTGTTPRRPGVEGLSRIVTDPSPNTLDSGVSQTGELVHLLHRPLHPNRTEHSELQRVLRHDREWRLPTNLVEALPTVCHTHHPLGLE